jgi:hypothetical protein
MAKNSKTSSNTKSNTYFDINLKGMVQKVDYKTAKLFRKHNLNRKEYQPHVKEILENIVKPDTLEYMSPIEVNVVTGNVIDGQHRLAAFKEAIEKGLLPEDSVISVFFIYVPKAKEIDVIISKQNKRSWGMVDYVEKEINASNSNYQILEAFAKSHSLTCDQYNNPKYGYAATFLKGKPCYTELRNGKLLIEQSDIPRAENLHKDVLQLLDAFGLDHKGRHINAITESWARHREIISLDKLCHLMTRKNQRQYAETLLKLERQNTKQWDFIFDTASDYICRLYGTAAPATITKRGGMTTNDAKNVINKFAANPDAPLDEFVKKCASSKAKASKK